MTSQGSEPLREWCRNYRLDLVGGLLMIPCAIVLMVFFGPAFIAFGLGGVYLAVRGRSGLARLRSVGNSESTDDN